MKNIDLHHFLQCLTLKHFCTLYQSFYLILFGLKWHILSTGNLNDHEGQPYFHFGA